MFVLVQLLNHWTGGKWKHFCPWILRRRSVDFSEVCFRRDITAMCQVYSALKLLFSVSKVLRFAPYTLLDNGVLVPSRAARRHSIILCICVFVSEQGMFEFVRMNNFSIIAIGISLIYWCSRTTHLLSVFISIRSHKKFQKITQNLNTFDSMLHQTSYAQKKRFYTILAQIGVGFISLVSFLFWNNFHFNKANYFLFWHKFYVHKATSFLDVAHKLAHIAVQILCFFGDFIVVLQYTNLVLFTGQHVSHINIKFAEIVHLCSQSPSTARVPSTVRFRSVSQITSLKPVGLQLRDQVSAVVNIHNKLLDTVPIINSVYSLQILGNVTKLFVHITFSIYSFLLTFSTEFCSQFKVHTLFLCFWSLFQLILTLSCCDCTKRQVSVA
jgi:hypothetical protein